MAIITRWRSPPLSWNEYSSKRRSGWGMPTMRSMSMPSARAVLFAQIGVQANGFHNLVAHGVEGTERRHGFLEDECDLAAADRPHLPPVGIQRRQVDFVHAPVAELLAEPDLAVGDFAGLFHDAQNGARGDALAAAAFADDAERLAGVDVKAGPVDRVHYAFILEVVGLEVLDGQNGEGRIGHGLRCFSI